MIGRQILLDMKLPEPERRAVEEAIILLSRSGVLLLAIEAGQKRFLNNFSKESTEELAKEIEIYRSESRPMRALHDFGLQLMKERNEK